MDNQVEFKRCPECLNKNLFSAKFCSECAAPLQINSVQSSSDPNGSAVKTIFLTIAATLTAVALAGGAYYVGMKSAGNSEIAAQPANIAVQNASFTSPMPSAVPLSANAAVNTNAAAISANANKAVKKVDSNSEVKIINAKKRALADGESYGWTYVTQTSDSASGYYYFYKNDSIKKSGDSQKSVEIWARMFPMYPDGFAKDEDLKTPVNYTVQKIRFFCKDDTYYPVAETFFDADGSSIPDNSRGYRTSQAITPGTTLETLSNIACSDE